MLTAIGCVRQNCTAIVLCRNGSSASQRAIAVETLIVMPAPEQL